MPLFNVRVERVVTRSITVSVFAETKAEAEAEARERAPDMSGFEEEVEWRVAHTGLDDPFKELREKLK